MWIIDKLKRLEQLYKKIQTSDIKKANFMKL